MAKTKEELSEIKNRVNELSTVLQELSEDELNEVFGGVELGNWGNESAVGCNAFGDESAAPFRSFMNTLFKVGAESMPEWE